MAWRAVQVCHTRSIGNTEIRQPPPGVYPHDLGDGVHRLGHNAQAAFGAHSYLVVRDGANVMVDSPRWTRQVVEPVEARGGIDVVLLTHRDDVPDAGHCGSRGYRGLSDASCARQYRDRPSGQPARCPGAAAIRGHQVCQ